MRAFTVCIGVILIRINSILDTVIANSPKTKEIQYDNQILYRPRTLLNRVYHIHMAYYMHLYATVQ